MHPGGKDRGGLFLHCGVAHLYGMETVGIVLTKAEGFPPSFFIIKTDILCLIH